MKSFTDQKQRIATEDDVRASWSGVKGGRRFYCRLCGHQFQVSDKWRWVYAGNIGRPNLLVCERCDGPDVLEKYGTWWQEWETLSKTKFRYYFDLLDDSQKEAHGIEQGGVNCGKLDR